MGLEYDPLDRETSLTVTPAEGDARTTTTTWWDSGEMHTRTKPNETVETRFYNPRGEISEKRRAPKTGSVRTQDYGYDRDGNRTQDERGTHVFNARGQLVRWTRGPKYTDEGKEGTTVEYSLNGSGDVTRKEDSWKPEGVTGPTVTTNDYRGERLWKSTVTRPTQAGSQSTISRFFHDDFGSVTRVDTEFVGAGEEPGEDPPDGPDAPTSCAEMPATAEEHTTRYCFDEFERMVASRGQGVEKPTNYVYDGLDRKDRKVTEENGQRKTHDYSYVGTSELLSRETDRKGKKKAYDYDSDGRRLGQSVKKQDDPAPVFRPYAVDANGSVEGLENGDGQFGASDEDNYLYDPYGESEKVDDPAETEDPGLSDEAKDNPFRFEGFYFDSGVRTYDMQAREYRPDIGRFLSQDRYESAVGDELLQADPLTQNRYAFAGGNPVSNVEFDGHHASICALGKCQRGGGGRRPRGRRTGGGIQRGAPARGVVPTRTNPIVVRSFPGGRVVVQQWAPTGVITFFPLPAQGRKKKGGGLDPLGAFADAFSWGANAGHDTRRAVGAFGENVGHVVADRAVGLYNLFQPHPSCQRIAPCPTNLDVAVANALRNPKRSAQEGLAAQWERYTGQGWSRGLAEAFVDIATLRVAAAGQGASRAPRIKPGSAGGATEGKVFPKRVKDQARAYDPTATCVFCGRVGAGTEIDHAVPRSRGGNATIDNAQLACPWCNRSKGAGTFPRNPPPNYVGPWPPGWWGYGGW